MCAVHKAVHEAARLNEAMCQFWHDRFSANGAKDELTAALFPAHDRAFASGIRRHRVYGLTELFAVSEMVEIHAAGRGISRLYPGAGRGDWPKRAWLRRVCKWGPAGA